MYGDIYPMKYKGKQLICLAGRNFGCHKTHRFKPNTCAAERANNIQLLMLVLDFIMNSRLKNTQWHFY